MCIYYNFDNVFLFCKRNFAYHLIQYFVYASLPDFIDWVKHLQKDVHNPPTLGITDPHRQLDFLITPGSQDGLCKVSLSCDAGDICCFCLFVYVLLMLHLLIYLGLCQHSIIILGVGVWIESACFLPLIKTTGNLPRRLIF